MHGMTTPNQSSNGVIQACRSFTSHLFARRSIIRMKTSSLKDAFWTLLATGFMKRGRERLLNLHPSGKNQFPPCIFPSFSQVCWEREIGALAQTSDKQVPLGIKRGNIPSFHHDDDCKTATQLSLVCQSFGGFTGVLFFPILAPSSLTCSSSRIGVFSTNRKDPPSSFSQ